MPGYEPVNTRLVIGQRNIVARTELTRTIIACKRHLLSGRSRHILNTGNAQPGYEPVNTRLVINRRNIVARTELTRTIIASSSTFYQRDHVTEDAPPGYEPVYTGLVISKRSTGARIELTFGFTSVYNNYRLPAAPSIGDMPAFSPHDASGTQRGSSMTITRFEQALR